MDIRDTANDFKNPIKGLNEFASYEGQPSDSTPDCLNVRPFDIFEGRARLGQRPGVVKAYEQQVSASSPIQLLSKVSMTGNQGFVYWADDFIGSKIKDVWLGVGDDSAYSWVGPDGKPRIAGGGYCYCNIGESRGAIRRRLDKLDTDDAYCVEMEILTGAGQFHGEYNMYLRMNSLEYEGHKPNVTRDGVHIQLTMTGSTGAWTGFIKAYKDNAQVDVVTGAGTNVLASGTDGPATSGWLKAYVTGNTIKVTWKDHDLTTNYVNLPDHASRQRVAFEINQTTSTVYSGCRIGHFLIRNTESTSSNVGPVVIAVAGGAVYQEESDGTLADANVDIEATDLDIQAAEMNQKLYIGDRLEAALSSGSGTLSLSGTSNILTVSGVDFTALGVDKDVHVVEITEAADEEYDSVYRISAVGTTTLTLTRAAGDFDPSAACNYKVTVPPKEYDPSAKTLTILQADTYTAAESKEVLESDSVELEDLPKGAVPQHCKLWCRYRGRLVAARTPTNPHVWFASRQGDPHDWDFGNPTDDQRAVAGTETFASVAGDAINALVPQGDNRLLFGCENSIWVLDGDPSDGAHHILSDVVGILDQDAWCSGPSGETYFLSNDGLYVLPPSQLAEGVQESMSRAALPERFVNINVSETRVSMAYDTRFRGVHIFLSSRSEGNSEHWWFDYVSKGFWPVLFGNTDHDPFACFTVKAAGVGLHTTLLGCRDGYVRRFSTAQETDEGTEIESYCVLGPYRMGGDADKEGMVTELQAVLAERSGSVNWSLYVGESAEASIGASAVTEWQGTWEAGVNATDRPRARGQSVALKVENAESLAWAIERITARSRPVGKLRT